MIMRSLSLLVPFTALLLSACTPEVGGSCSDGDVTCKDANTKLFCKDGKYVAMACKGEEGCKEKDGTLTCDISGNADGDVCAKANEGKGRCSPDGKSQVLCLDEKVAVIPCRGENGCETNGDTSTCDRSIAKVDERCRNTGKACSDDKKQMLRCEEDKYIVDSECRGEKGCRVEGSKVICDQSVGLAGDPCTSGSACSADGKQMLSCQDGKLALQTHCRGENGCRRDGSKIRCDQTHAEEGDKCSGEGAACSVDKKAMLDCKDGTFIKSKDCRFKDCSVEEGKIYCR